MEAKDKHNNDKESGIYERKKIQWESWKKSNIQL